MTAPSPHAVVHRAITLAPAAAATAAPVQVASAWRADLRPRRPSNWRTIAGLAAIVALLSVYVWTLHATPTADATRVARTVPR